MAIDGFATSIPGGTFASRQFVRWFWAISFALVACLVGSPCPTQTGSVRIGSARCGQAGCTALTINGRHACASLAVDFKRAAATAKLTAPRVQSGPLGASTFELHSRPGATKIIYLDFDGHVTRDTWWNSSRSKRTITTTAFNIDNDPTTFSTAEQATIVEIWQRVSECYSPFDIDVTTASPTVADLVNSGAGDTKWGMRVLFGNSSPSPAQGAGGVAYLFSFGENLGNGVDLPCFVLQDGVGTVAKYNADAAVHEVGHTLGLYHDGQLPSSEYYEGQGTGNVAWAPHMGVGYYRPLVQWSKGEYANPSNTEDDLNIITNGQWGFGYRPDDYSNTTSAAQPIPGTAGSSSFAVNVNGVIETRADVDMFKITTGSGTIKLDAVGGPACTMLDIQLSLYDSNGALVVAANPPTDVIASISQTVPAGVYYAKIEGVGLGNPLTTGYTDYGSLGQYTITGSFSANNSNYVVVDYNLETKLMTITDDVGDNSFAIKLRAGQITVEGTGGTLIGNSANSSQSVSFPFDSNSKINVNCTTGNDTVSFNGVRSPEINAVMGDGNDRVRLIYCNIVQFYMNGQDGTDILTLFGSKVTKKFTYSVP